MVLPFVKMHGNGNDFIMLPLKHAYTFMQDNKLDLPFCFTSVLAQWCRTLCDRHRGIGADGVVFWAKEEGKPLQVLFVNADGSRATTCGNALRCLALSLKKDGVWPGITPLSVYPPEDPSTPLAELLFATDDHACVSMGNCLQVFSLEPASFVPPGVSQPPVFVQLANPHVVWLGGNFPQDFAFFEEWGKKTQELACTVWKVPLSNVGFLDVSRQKLVVYERGAGLTLCCGSGAVAAHVALEHLSLKDRPAPSFLELPGGNVHVKTAGDAYQLEGPAAFVFQGVLEAEEVSG